jgi:hypothetical protein
MQGACDRAQRGATLGNSQHGKLFERRSAGATESERPGLSETLDALPRQGSNVTP